MISYRSQLQKIGYQPGTPVSYRQFASRPTSLRQAMRSMDAPSHVPQATEAPGQLDKGWTEECQGVVWDGAHWIFSSNGSDLSSPFGHEPKALFTFNGSNGSFDEPDHTFIIATVDSAKAAGNIQPKIPEPSLGWIYHVGSLLYYEGLLYVDHWNSLGGQLIVFQLNNGIPQFVKWIDLKSVDSYSVDGERVGLVGINPWDEMIYTSHGGVVTDKLYIHNMDGLYTNRTLLLNPPINDDCYVQGGFFSPNGHVYIASGRRDDKKDDNSPHKGAKEQYIYCYSALNGSLMATIPVLSLEGNQELEGICYADVTRAGQRVQIHAILLDNISLAKDNVYFKSFAADQPDWV